MKLVYKYLQLFIGDEGLSGDKIKIDLRSSVMLFNVKSLFKDFVYIRIDCL
jgi:hypothetical protein